MAETFVSTFVGEWVQIWESNIMTYLHFTFHCTCETMRDNT